MIKIGDYYLNDLPYLYSQLMSFHKVIVYRTVMLLDALSLLHFTLAAHTAETRLHTDWCSPLEWLTGGHHVLSTASGTMIITTAV